MHRAALALGLCGGCSLIVDPPDGVHPEQLVNSIHELDQGDPVVVFASDRYFVAWQDGSLTPPDTSDRAIRGRFVDPAGSPLGSDLLVNDPALARFDQEAPHAAALGPNVMIAWTDKCGLGGDADASIRGRVISMSGDFVSGEVLINTTVAGAQQEVAIAAAGSAFVLVWTDASAAAPDASGSSIRGRRLAANGDPIDAADWVINTTTAGNQTEATVATGADGKLLVAWTDAATTGSTDIRGRLLGADGRPLAADFAINTTLAGSQSEPFAIGLRGGGYLVAWTDDSHAPGDLDGRAVRGRLVDARGAALGEDFVLATTTRGDQAAPKVAMLADGSLMLAFEDASLSGPDTAGNSTRARRLSADGTPLGADFLVNTYYESDQEDAAMAADATGGVLFVYEDQSAGSADASGEAIEARLVTASQ